MHQVLFYPVGNGDTSQIVLANGRRVLFDYRHLKKAEDGKGPEIDLKARLTDELAKAKRDYFDVVAFTHGDDDHIAGSTEFFELQHAQCYQGDGRVKIKELWVPAAMILEPVPVDKRDGEFAIWQREAKHRLKKGTGIRVFSRPDKLGAWLNQNGLTLEERAHCIHDAGTIVPGFALDMDGVEFFVHSPFAKHVGEEYDMRNDAALIFNVRFNADGVQSDYLAIGDTSWEVLEDIVAITLKHGRNDRLCWDLFGVPHHCSYHALSDVRGEWITEPKPGVKTLLTSGRPGAYMACSSNPINKSGHSSEGDDPPHPEAYRCYKAYLRAAEGAQFMVTMEEPNTAKPAPMVFEVGADGVKLKATQSATYSTVGPAAVSSMLARPTPKAG